MTYPVILNVVGGGFAWYLLCFSDLVISPGGKNDVTAHVNTKHNSCIKPLL